MTKSTAEMCYVLLVDSRVEWCRRCVRGWPEMTPASSQAAAGAREEGRRTYGAWQGPVLVVFGSWELGEHRGMLKNGRGRLWPRQRHGTAVASSAVVGGRG